MYNINRIIEAHKGKKIAIIANGPTTKDGNGNYLDFSALYDNIWVLMGGWDHHDTACLGFNMHDQKGMKEAHDKEFYDTMMDSMSRAKIPIVTPALYDGCKNTVEYPLKQVVNKCKRLYFGETISYAVCFAMLCGVSEINIHGADYCGIRPEQRACLEYWLGVAEKSGIIIRIDINSHLLCYPPHNEIFNVRNFYGYMEDNFPFKIIKNSDGTVCFNVNS
jgi:hypothetical protein